MTLGQQVRKSMVAGSFYPDDPGTLKKQVNNFLNNAKDSGINNIISIICPHAGYMYSGQVAAYSYKQITGKKFDRIIIIAPSHSEYFDFVSVYNGSAYQTPLGQVEVDQKTCQLLSKGSKNIKVSSRGHLEEHSLEVQLPFLQVILKKFKMVPVVIGQQNRENILELGNSIGNLPDSGKTLIIASTDLSHYHPYREAMELDGTVEALINDFNWEGLMKNFLSNNAEMCGGGPVIASMIASQKLGANRSKILKYQNSGDVSGDRSAVVGYLSAAFYK
jgi:hypothetical protein